MPTNGSPATEVQLPSTSVNVSLPKFRYFCGSECTNYLNYSSHILARFARYESHPPRNRQPPNPDPQHHFLHLLQHQSPLLLVCVGETDTAGREQRGQDLGLVAVRLPRRHPLAIVVPLLEQELARVVLAQVALVVAIKEDRAEGYGVADLVEGGVVFVEEGRAVLGVRMLIAR